MAWRWLDRLEEGLLAVLLAGMTLITFVQVVARYVFNYSFVWALELTTWLFAGLIFLGMAYGVRVGAHIGVDAIVKNASERTARILVGVGAALGMLYAVLVFIGAWRYVSTMYNLGIEAQDLPVEQWIPRAVLPIGFAVLFLRFGEVLWRTVSGQKARLLGDEAEESLKLREPQPDRPADAP